MGSVHSSQNSLSVFLIHMFYLVWICGEWEERNADLFLSEFHKWVLAVVHFAVKGVGKFEVVGGRVEDDWGVLGPWEYGRFQVRNEANFWMVSLRSQWVGQIWQTATNPLPHHYLQDHSSVSFAMCHFPFRLSLLNIYNKLVTDMVLTEKRFTTLTNLTSLFSPRCTR